MSEQLVKTPDGKRTRVAELNTSVPESLKAENQGLLGRIGKAWANLNQVLAGMYTGVGCAGDVHTHHKYSDKDKNPN